MTDHIGPDPHERTAIARKFGVSGEQVRRDHLISHVLAALSTLSNKNDFVFFGGTALSRTLLPDLRLSEDIDLIALANRTTLAKSITDAVETGLARSHGEVRWLPRIDRTKGSEPAILQVAGSIRVQLQLMSSTGMPAWPTSVMAIEQRYSDTPSAELPVLTPDAFVAAKMSAWFDRRSARDLYDLWALGSAGFIGPDALELYKRLGPTSEPPPRRMFAEPPSEKQWKDSLGHQGRLNRFLARGSFGGVGPSGICHP